MKKILTLVMLVLVLFAFTMSVASATECAHVHTEYKMERQHEDGKIVVTTFCSDCNEVQSQEQYVAESNTNTTPLWYTWFLTVMSILIGIVLVLAFAWYMFRK